LILAAGLLAGMFLTACSDSDEPEGLSGDWLIPINDVKDGGPGKDGIPALTEPDLIPVSAVDFLEDDDLVIGLREGAVVRAYPHAILDWHEIINDNINGKPVAITYCPLTGTALGWDRMVNGTLTTFGVSGLLFNTNLLPYDRATDSHWSQMRLECVNGPLIGQKIKTYQLVETTWATWRQMYPQSMVVSTNTGISRPYEQYPYGDYITNNNRLLFPVNPVDERLPQKERVHGVVVGEAVTTYSINLFNDSVRLIEDRIGDRDVMVAGSRAANFVASFHAQLANDSTMLEFRPVQDALPVILTDNEGNQWDVFGYATEGPRQGQRLVPNDHAYMGYWFSWGAFHPQANIFQ
ncbi:MAG: DUF3179 domain-containing protein, partial [Bacteroidota bacterium]